MAGLSRIVPRGCKHLGLSILSIITKCHLTSHQFCMTMSAGTTALDGICPNLIACETATTVMATLAP